MSSTGNDVLDTIRVLTPSTTTSDSVAPPRPLFVLSESSQESAYFYGKLSFTMYLSSVFVLTLLRFTSVSVVPVTVPLKAPTHMQSVKNFSYMDLAL